MVDTRTDTSALYLERFLKERGLDVYTPTMRGNLRRWWVQFASGPFDLEHNIPKLMKIAEELRRSSPEVRTHNGQLVVVKIDSTRDVRGSFYAPEDWKGKHKALGKALEKVFGCRFHDNGNSYRSCFQFEGQPDQSQLMLRVKIYWKTLQLLQSESVTKSVGMNTKAMFYPTMRMGQALIESRE